MQLQHGPVSYAPYIHDERGHALQRGEIGGTRMTCLSQKACSMALIWDSRRQGRPITAMNVMARRPRNLGSGRNGQFHHGAFMGNCKWTFGHPCESAREFSKTHMYIQGSIGVSAATWIHFLVSKNNWPQSSCMKYPVNYLSKRRDPADGQAVHTHFKSDWLVADARH